MYTFFSHPPGKCHCLNELINTQTVCTNINLTSVCVGSKVAGHLYGKRKFGIIWKAYSHVLDTDYDSIIRGYEDSKYINIQLPKKIQLILWFTQYSEVFQLKGQLESLCTGSIVGNDSGVNKISHYRFQ
jgi:hypothetical protein